MNISGNKSWWLIQISRTLNISFLSFVLFSFVIIVVVWSCVVVSFRTVPSPLDSLPSINSYIERWLLWWLNGTRTWLNYTPTYTNFTSTARLFILVNSFTRPSTIRWDGIVAMLFTWPYTNSTRGAAFCLVAPIWPITMDCVVFM